MIVSASSFAVLLAPQPANSVTSIISTISKQRLFVFILFAPCLSRISWLSCQLFNRLRMFAVHAVPDGLRCTPRITHEQIHIVIVFLGASWVVPALSAKPHTHSSFAKQDSKRNAFTGFTRKPSIPTANALSRFSEAAFAVKATIGVFARIRLGSFRIRNVDS